MTLICAFFQVRSLPVENINFPLKTGSNQNGQMFIYDSSGQRVKLACVNWSGFQLTAYVANGLDKQPIDFIAGKIASMGFNCVRLVNSLDIIYKNPVVEAERLTANPELIGKTAMQIHDAVVEALTTNNIMVIINNHNSNAGWCCSDEDFNGLWYTDEYPEQVFLDHWTFMAQRYAENPLVIGADLRNELRGVPDEDAVGGTKYASWGVGIETTDWNVAAEKAAQLVHQANPNMLVFVGGLLFGTLLSPAVYAPIRLEHQDKLVYTGHIYTWSVPGLYDLPDDIFEITLETMQTFVAQAGHNYSAPFWMGEFGAGSGSSQEKWRKLIRMLKEHDYDWAVWTLDGYQ